MNTLSMVRNGLVLALALSCAAHAEEAVKIAFVDLERAINEVDEGSKAKADLKKEFEKKQAELDKRQNDVKALSDSIESKSAVMKPEAKQAKVMEVQKKVAEVQQLYMSMQQDMMKRQNEVMGNILQKMNIILQTMGTDGSYTAILNRTETSLLYGKPHLDLSNELIRRYNESYGKGKSADGKAKAKK